MRPRRWTAVAVERSDAVRQRCDWRSPFVRHRPHVSPESYAAEIRRSRRGRDNRVAVGILQQQCCDDGREYRPSSRARRDRRDRKLPHAVGTFHISVTAGEIVFQFSSTVPQADQQLIRDAIASGQTYFASTFRWSPTSKVTLMVNARTNPPTGVTSRSTLEEQGFYDGTRAPYSLGYLAADELVGNKGLTSLMTFGTSVEVSGVAAAFEAAFGRPLSACYSEFEQYRRSWPDAPESACGTWF